MDSEEIEALIDQAESMPDGRPKVEVLVDAVRRADVLEDLSFQFFARHCLIQAAFLAGQPTEMYTALSWCLARSEDEPEYIGNWLLWQCKHALAYATSFHTLSRKQICELADDVIRRYQAYGASLRGPYNFVMVCHMYMGDRPEAHEYHELWQAAPLDEFTESKEWEAFFNVDYLVYKKDIDGALELASPMLEQPALYSEIYPWLGHHFQLEYLKRGELERAMTLFRRCYRLCKQSPRFLSHIGQLIGFLVLTRNSDKAIELFERHLQWRLNAAAHADQLDFDVWAWTLMRHLTQDGRQTVKMQLPPDFPQYDPSGSYRTDELAQWFSAKVEDLTAKFDARNGNTYISNCIAEVQKLDEFMTDYPLTD